jgi:putative acetyltransferase
MTQHGVKVVEAQTAEQIAVCRALFEEYAAWIGVDLSYQGFAAELAGLPGLYAPPRGGLFVALDNLEPAGCVALRPLDGDICEMKRLFVRPAYRARGVGRQLAGHVVRAARDAGYAAMRLDTLPFMGDALRLYERLGFARCAPYYETPIEGTVFMELHL